MELYSFGMRQKGQFPSLYDMTVNWFINPQGQGYAVSIKQITGFVMFLLL